ncbi:hypothetical protein NDU88_002198 [Pleurodeles waltl]|uniref:Uncharacterized protein n=1 Tax=Pleurodeles waltl TaxID=8319 RepID=A0AAV7WKQ9_PLEWA|nr:hypothetical protein NDU88_002198 [Pleurodeles waltl]
MTGTSSSPAARIRASPPGTDAITDPAAQQPTRIVLGGHLPAAQPPGQPLMWQVFSVKTEKQLSSVKVDSGG